MAKVSDLSDTQLEKTFRQYHAKYKQEKSDKLKKLLLQLDHERKKRRGNAGARSVKPPSSSSSSLSSSPGGIGSGESSLMELAMAADKSVRVKKVESDKATRMSRKMQRGPGPMITRNMGNILLFSGLGVGGLGLILLADDYILNVIPPFAYKAPLYWVLLVVGIALSKATSFLSDDSR